MAAYNLALIFENPSNDAEFLLLRQTPPPKFGNAEYDSFVDSPLWDLPFTYLRPLEARLELSATFVKGLDEANLGELDIDSAINRVLQQVGFNASDVGEWRFLKCAEEPEFGPELPVRSVYIAGRLVTGNQHLSDECAWMSVQSCLSCLLDVKSSCDRVGPLAAIGLVNDSVQSTGQKVQTTLRYQEYPPGVVIVPMKSRTAKPFHTTNLVIFAPESVLEDCEDDDYVARGDALIVDPGCRSNSHGELLEIVSALPRKLVVLVTHHHHDHVDGLSVIQKCNPDATLLAHENTMRRIAKGDWSLGYTSVSGGEDICIGGHKLNVIFAPGHTDGHVALLHASTQSLIVGDHCVGQGSSLLDINSGGNMTDYFESTYKFIDLAPHVLIPMHGRVNLWPKNMLCGYLRNRRSREESILKAIENGAKTLIDMISTIYSNVDRILWIPASYNVRLHVEHLAQENKLPKEFSIQKFERSCRIHFYSRWLLAFLTAEFLSRSKKHSTRILLISGAIASFAVLYSFIYHSNSFFKERQANTIRGFQAI